MSRRRQRSEDIVEPSKKYKSDNDPNVDITQSETFLSTTSTIEPDVDPMISACMDKILSCYMNFASEKVATLNTKSVQQLKAKMDTLNENYYKEFNALRENLDVKLTHIFSKLSNLMDSYPGASII